MEIIDKESKRNPIIKQMEDLVKEKTSILEQNLEEFEAWGISEEAYNEWAKTRFKKK